MTKSVTKGRDVSETAQSVDSETIRCGDHVSQPKGETSIKRAALINMVSRYAAAFIGLVYSVILARILTPGDFGVVAIAQVFVTFYALFQDMGLGSAIIQRRDLDDADVSRLFGFSVLLAGVLGLLFALTGIPIAFIYGVAELRSICAMLALTVVLATLNTVPNALLMKSKRFLIVGARQVACVIVASCLGLVSALAGAGPYAIVVYSVSNAFLQLAWNWLTNRVFPSFRGCMESVHKVWGYSAWLFGFNIITYFSRNTDNLLVGYFFGAADLGNYGKAYQLMQYPQTYLTSVITGVLHPMLAEQQDSVDYIYDVYIRITKALSLIGVFVSVYCFFSADEIVGVLYGEQWHSSAVCLRLLSVSIWSQMVCGASGPVFQVLNRTREQFVRGLLISFATIGATIAGVLMGSIESVALLVGIAYLFPFILLVPFLIQKSFHKSPRTFLSAFLPDLTIAALMALSMRVVDSIPIVNPLASMLIKLVACGTMYLVLVVASGQVRWLSVILPARLRKRIPKRVIGQG